MSNVPDERDRALQSSLWSLFMLLIVGSISAAVVVLFGIVFHP